MACGDIGNQVIFQSSEALEAAIAPFGKEEFESRTGFSFKIEEDSLPQPIPLRNPPNDLFKWKLQETPSWTLFMPESPRVPHHLVLRLQRDVRSITEISPEENRALFSLIRRCAEIYSHVFSIQGFVISRYDTPQRRHEGRCVVELLPQLVEHNAKNLADKIDSNRYVLFGNENLTPARYDMVGVTDDVDAWQKALSEEHPPLSRRSVEYPTTRADAYIEVSQRILRQHIMEFLHDRGGIVPFHAERLEIPTALPESVKTIALAKCFFCEQSVLDRQTVLEYNGIVVLYNMRKGTKPGCNFLILPKEHHQKTYALSEEQIDAMAAVRQALVQVLKEAHPERDVFIYTQDDPSVGQTVFHHHEQVVAFDPKIDPFAWTVSSLFPSKEGMSAEEMQEVTEEFREKLLEKLEPPSEEAVVGVE